MKRFLILFIALCFVGTAHAYRRDSNSVDHFGNHRWFGTSVSTGDVIEAFQLPLNEFQVNGTPMAADGTTDPGIAVTDNIPAIVWQSGETASIQQAFFLPSLGQHFKLSFRVMLSQSDSGSTATSAPQIAWKVYVHEASKAVSTTAYTQTSVTPEFSTTSNVVAWFRPNASLIEALSTSGGKYCVLDLWNVGTSNGTTEIKDVFGVIEKK